MALTSLALDVGPPAPSSGSGPCRPAPGITPATPLLWAGPTAVSLWPRLASSTCWGRQAIRSSQVPMPSVGWPAVAHDPGTPP